MSYFLTIKNDYRQSSRLENNNCATDGFQLLHNSLLVVFNRLIT